ncbi:MAG TPA: nuclear transport factor 2 family protein [Mycobacteriales bacterium]|nr:nuclear transport factor 2 family protein [Mycobacteriales bacterium]
MCPAAEELTAIERLKAAYCRTLDTKDWSGFRELFADDFVSDTSESGGVVIEGADAFVAFVRDALSRAVTVHQVQQPELELTSATTARGVWAMQDVVRFAPGITMHGFGHYLETYVKTGDAWRLKSSKLTRLREEIRTPFVTLFVSERLRRRLQRLAARRMTDRR